MLWFVATVFMQPSWRLVLMANEVGSFHAPASVTAGVQFLRAEVRGVESWRKSVLPTFQGRRRSTLETIIRLRCHSRDEARRIAEAFAAWQKREIHVAEVASQALQDHV
jgi:hypothetical protein